MPSVKTRSRTKAQAAPSSRAARAWLVLLFAFLSAVVCYAPVARQPLYEDAGGHGGDTAFYVALQQGQPLMAQPRPYRYRVLTPWLASGVPFLPEGLAQRYSVSPDKVIQFQFGVVNAALLLLAALSLYAWLEALGFGPREALLACLLFYGSFHVVVDAGAAMVEAGAYASLALGLCLATRGPAWAFGLAFGIGLFFKETAAFLLPAVWLAFDGAKRWKLLVCTLPGLAAYAVFRGLLYPGGPGADYGWASIVDGLSLLASPSFSVYVLLEFLLCFGPLWWLAWRGWRGLKAGQPLRRLGPWALLFVAAPFLLHTVYGRVFFLGFPVVLPLAVLGLRELWPERAAV